MARYLARIRFTLTSAGGRAIGLVRKAIPGVTGEMGIVDPEPLSAWVVVEGFPRATGMVSLTLLPVSLRRTVNTHHSRSNTTLAPRFPAFEAPVAPPLYAAVSELAYTEASPLCELSVLSTYHEDGGRGVPTSPPWPLPIGLKPYL